MAWPWIHGPPRGGSLSENSRRWRSSNCCWLARGCSFSTSPPECSCRMRSTDCSACSPASGNGQREPGDVSLGLTQTAGGKKIIHGQDATRWSVDRIRRSGVAFVPEDPLRMLIVPPLSVLENMALADTRKYARHVGLTVDWIAVRRDLEQTTRRLALEMLPPAVPAGTLSGGNVQRLSFVRELAIDPRLVVALYPTTGLDVRGATAARHLLLAMRKRGAGEMLSAADLGER